MTSLSVERSVWINAPREKVWQALINPEMIEQWFSPGTAWQLSDLAVGGLLYVLDSATGEQLYTQRLTTVEPPHTLILATVVEPPNPIFTTHYSLTEHNQGTQLTLRYSGYEGLAENIRHQAMAENGTGFELMLGNIKALLEGTPLPQPGGF